MERTHLIEYGVVAALIHQALQERMRNGRPVPGPAALAVLITALVGLVDEGLQAVIPSRVFDWNDVLFNALAAFMVIVARLAIAPVRRPGWRLWFVWVIASGFGFGWSMDPSLFGEPRTYEVLPSLPILAMPHYQSVAVGGIVVGAFQWLALRRYIAASLLWLPATIGAVVLSGAALVALGGLDADQGWVVSAALYGTLAGLLQWTVLRGQTTRAAWWVWGSTVGWVVAIPAGGIIGPPGWAAYGEISGTVLVWLLQSGAHELHAPDDLMHRAD